MEHPEYFLIVSDNNTEQQAVFGLLFKEEFPTYQERLNGKPKLSLTLDPSQQYVEGKTHLVAPTGIEPVLQA